MTYFKVNYLGIFKGYAYSLMLFTDCSMVFYENSNV